MSRALSLALLAPVVALAVSARADEGEDRRFTWRPSVQVRAALNDNITLTEDEDADVGAWIAPRLEAAWRTPDYQLGFDGTLDVHNYTDSKDADETFYRVHSFAEAGLLPGLSFRVSDSFTPQPRALGLPEDEPVNLLQTNRAEAELRYWHELPGQREITVAALGGRFDAERFAALVEGPGGAVVLDPGFRADFWEGAGVVELQNPFGDQHAAYLRGLARQRSFDDPAGADHLEASGLLGFRSHMEQGLELDVAGGWGVLDLSGSDTESSLLGRASLAIRRPGGWRYHLGLHHQLTVDVAGNEFVDTTGRLGVEKYFGKRTAVSLIGFLSQLDSDSTSPSGNRFGGAELKVRRQLSRRVEASLAYRHWENAGSFELDDMRQDRAMLSLTYRH
jgi:hypothetical protein